MQIGKVMFRSRWSVQRLLISRELNQIAGDETRGESQVSKDLHQQPAGISTRADTFFKGFLAALYTGVESDCVVNMLLQALIECDQKQIDVAFLAVDPVQPGHQARATLGEFEVRLELLPQ